MKFDIIGDIEGIETIAAGQVSKSDRSFGRHTVLDGGVR